MFNRHVRPLARYCVLIWTRKCESHPHQANDCFRAHTLDLHNSLSFKVRCLTPSYFVMVSWMTKMSSDTILVGSWSSKPGSVYLSFVNTGTGCHRDHEEINTTLSCPGPGSSPLSTLTRPWPVRFRPYPLSQLFVSHNNMNTGLTSWGGRRGARTVQITNTAQARCRLITS